MTGYTCPGCAGTEHAPPAPPPHPPADDMDSVESRTRQAAIDFEMCLAGIAPDVDPEEVLDEEFLAEARGFLSRMLDRGKLENPDDWRETLATMGSVEEFRKHWGGGEQVAEKPLEAAHPDVAAEPWQPDGTGFRPGGDIGGDTQATDSHSVRFVKDGGRRLTTVYAYGVTTADGRYAVEVQTEWLVCTDPKDPGGTEVWSDGVHQTLDETAGHPTYATPEEAERAALEVLRQQRAHLVDWDGRAEWET